MNINDDPTHVSWRSMIARCKYPYIHGWKNYGGRGISVCDRWKESYWNFFDDMGPRPPDGQLGRIDNDGDYTPENCEWQTRIENARNRRNTHYVICKGKKISTAEAAEVLGVNRTSLYFVIGRIGGGCCDVTRVHIPPPRKLTAGKVRRIRRMKLPASKTADRFGVSKSLIKAIRRGEIWKDV